MNDYSLFSFFREMLERALVKRLSDSDSESDQEEEKGKKQPKRHAAENPTDILTTDKEMDAKVQLH